MTQDEIRELEVLLEKARKPAPFCPYDRRSPEYFTAPDDKPCAVCGQENTPEGEDKCRGADTRAIDAVLAQVPALLATARKLREVEIERNCWYSRACDEKLCAEAAESDRDQALAERDACRDAANRQLGYKRAAQAEVERLRGAISRAVDESTLNQQRFEKDTDIDYFLGCFRAVNDDLRAALNQDPT